MCIGKFNDPLDAENYIDHINDILNSKPYDYDDWWKICKKKTCNIFIIVYPGEEVIIHKIKVYNADKYNI